MAARGGDNGVGFPTERHRGILGSVGIPLYVSLGGNLTVFLNQNLQLSAEKYT